MQTNDHRRCARGIKIFKSRILEMGDFLMKDNKNIEFLNSIYQIVEMGIIGINDVMDKVSKSEFRTFLENQKKEYDDILKESETIFTSYGAKEKELGKMAKISSKMMSEMKLMKNNDDTVIVEMMVEGTNKGITKLESAMSTYNEEDEEAYKLAEKLLSTLKNNIEGLKIYL